MESGKLLSTLEERGYEIINYAQKWQQLPIDVLTWRPSPTAWNTLECLRHLNMYGDFYLPVFKECIAKSTTEPEIRYKSGWLGRYMARAMLPGGKTSKMKTFKDKDPIHQVLDKREIQEFLRQQEVLMAVLNEARMVSLMQVKVPISISSIVKLRLGDALMFYTNHIERHIEQIRAIELARKTN